MSIINEVNRTDVLFTSVDTLDVPLGKLLGRLNSRKFRREPDGIPPLPPPNRSDGIFTRVNSRRLVIKGKFTSGPVGLPYEITGSLFKHLIKGLDPQVVIKARIDRRIEDRIHEYDYNYAGRLTRNKHIYRSETVEVELVA